MKKSFLLPHSCMRVGLILLVPFFIMFCLEMAGAAPEITITMPCLANNELLDGTVWFTLLQGEDIFMEIWIFGLLVSLLFIALSKEKVEDEMILQIRLQSMLHALWVTSLCFVLETLFLFGFAYAYSLWATLYIFLLFFILKFRYELYQLKKAEKMKNTIKVERAIKNMTQQDLAAAIGVSRQTINSIESGKYVPSTVLALKIAAYFGKTVDEIFQLEEGD